MVCKSFVENIYIFMVYFLVSWLRVCLSAEGAKNVSWPWLSPLRRWGSLTMALTGKFVYIWLTISSCCGSIPLTLGSIGRDGGLSTLCHSCRFACKQRMLKTFPGPGYIRSEDGLVWLWHLLVNLLHQYKCAYPHMLS